MAGQIIILGIESSCDDTSAAVSLNDKILANVVAGQEIHALYGGVVPELASRAHQQKIIYVVDKALRQANVSKKDLSAVACTTGPGLMGSLLVGLSFAKGFAAACGIPVIGVNHMQAHVLAHFADLGNPDFSPPEFPFICLTVSGGHTQLLLVKGPFDMELVGQTIDDAAGEAFDKVAKVMGFSYPGGPVIDKLAAGGNISRFRFPHPSVPGLDYSFSGLKTAILYFLKKEVSADPDFIRKNQQDICASVQETIVRILAEKALKAVKAYGVTHLAVSGGVSANSRLRAVFAQLCHEQGVRLHIPHISLCTDNAAMIAVTGFFKFREGAFSTEELFPEARFSGMH